MTLLVSFFPRFFSQMVLMDVVFLRPRRLLKIPAMLCLLSTLSFCVCLSSFGDERSVPDGLACKRPERTRPRQEKNQRLVRQSKCKKLRIHQTTDITVDSRTCWCDVGVIRCKGHVFDHWCRCCTGDGRSERDELNHWFKCCIGVIRHVFDHRRRCVGDVRSRCHVLNHRDWFIACNNKCWSHVLGHWSKRIEVIGVSVLRLHVKIVKQECTSLHADLDPCSFAIAMVARSDHRHS